MIITWYRNYVASARSMLNVHSMKPAEISGSKYILFILMFTLCLFLPAFLHEGPLLQTDQPLWVAATHVWFHQVIPAEKWIWGTITDRAGAGQIMGDSYSASLILPCLFHLVFSEFTAVKMSMLLCAFVFLVSMFRVARLYVGPRLALLTSFLVFSPIFDNLVSGMWYNYLSLAFALLFWCACDQYVRRTRRTKSLVWTSLSFAGAVYSHPIGVFMIGAIWVAYCLLIILTERTRGKWLLLVGMTAAPVVGLLLAAPQVFGILALSQSAALRNASALDHLTMTPVLEFLRRLSFIRVWGASSPGTFSKGVMVLEIGVIMLLSGAGLIRITRRNVNIGIPIIMLILLNMIMLSRLFIYFRPIIGDGLTLTLSEFYDRFQLITQIYLALLSVTGLGVLIEGGWRPQLGGKSRVVLRSCYVLGVFVLLLHITVKPFQKIYVDRTGQLGTLDASPLHSQLIAFWDWVRSNVDSSRERIYVEDTYGKIHWNRSNNPEAMKTHVLALTSVYTKAFQVGGWCGFTNGFAKTHEVGGVFYVDSHRENEDAAIFDEMRKLNCKYVVAVSKQLITRLERVSFLKKVLVLDMGVVFENTVMSPAFAYSENRGTSVRFTEDSVHQYELQLDGSSGELIHISMAYHPGWKAYVDGAPVPVVDEDELVELRLAKSGPQKILLRYEIERTKPLLLFGVGVAGLLILLCVTLSGKKG
jgi:hypothetical protein